MGEAVEIGVRYCGGCNPRYDRVALINRLAKLLPEFRFVVAQQAKSYFAVLLVCGCPNRCVSMTGLTVPPERLLNIGGWEDLLSIREKLLQLLDTPEVRRLDRDGVIGLLPHRPPMLLVDEAPKLVPGVEAEARLSVSEKLPCFDGHFPQMPVLPGIYLLEAMAQTADLLLLSLPCYEGHTPLFMGVRQAHFRARVLPGDRLDLHAALVQERRELGYALCRCQVFREEELVADAQIQLSMQAPERRPEGGLRPTPVSSGRRSGES